MDPTKNLVSLHAHEEELRIRSLQLIEKKQELLEHWIFIAESMNVIFAFAHDHAHQSDDEMTLQLLGIRLFNAAGSSIKLGLSGYYQKSFDQIRDVVETGFLVDFFRSNPDQIRIWKNADQRTRISKFGAGIIRNALDKRDGLASGARKAIYDLISENASHASYRGFNLFMNSNNLGETGPFFEEKKLIVWVEELATRLLPAAVSLVADHEVEDPALLNIRSHYLGIANAWKQKYFPNDNQNKTHVTNTPD